MDNNENNNKKTMPWEEYPEIWKNQTAFFAYLRGCLRKAWNNNPVKHSYIKKNRKKIPNPNPKGNRKEVWGFECESCGKDHVMKEGQVDHINPSGGLNDIEDIQGFVERLLVVTDDDIRLICKPCHRIITNMERYGHTYEEELIEMQVRDLKKLKVDKIRAMLEWIGLDSTGNKQTLINRYRDSLYEEE